MKNFIIFVLSFCLLLYSCSDAKSIRNVGTDGYAFHSKQFDNKQVLISIVTFKTWDEFRAEGERQGMDMGSGDDTTIAFSILDKDNQQICTIYMIDPEVYYLPEYAGHEFLHCAYGQFHIDNDSKGYDQNAN